MHDDTPSLNVMCVRLQENHLTEPSKKAHSQCLILLIKARLLRIVVPGYVVYRICETLRLLTGYDPFPWQVALFNEFRAGEFPRSACLPTGLGKPV